MPPFYVRWFYRARLALLGPMVTKAKPKPMVFSGPDSTQSLCRLIDQFGLRHILVVTDKPLRDLGALDSTLAALESLGITTTIYDGVQPDPTAQVIDEGIAVLNQHRCDSVLAFGGGSSIDSAKVIALGAPNNKSAADCVGINKCKQPSLPFFAIPTTAGTGSECTFIAVVSDNDTHEKDGVLDEKMVPKATALDPVIMQGMPVSITAATGMDALTHAIESYIGKLRTDESDFYGLAATRLIFANLPEACRNGSDLEAREAMALASFYGGLAISNALVGYVHAISHNLGARYGIPHGLGNAMVLPHVLERLQQDVPGKFAELAVHAGLGSASEGNAALARKLVERVWRLNEEIGIPRQSELIKGEDIDELVEAAYKEGITYPTPRYFGREEIRDILLKLKVAS